MKLETSEEQLAAIVAALRRGAEDPWSKGTIADDIWPTMASEAWSAIAPMVLEAAARVCEEWGKENRWNECSAREAAEELAALLQDLKGKAP